MENRGYTIIQDWMLDMPLSLVETAVYAIIYGFSQDGESTFSGSLSFIARKSKTSKDTARRALNRLVDEGYLERISVVKNGVTFNDYRVREMQGGIANCNGGDSKLQPQNKEQIKDIDICSNKGARRVFIPPTLDEVTYYCIERNNTINPQAFISYYESNGWMVGKNRMKDWKAAVRSWESREQKDRRGKQPVKKESYFQHNNRVLEELLGGQYNG